MAKKQPPLPQVTMPLGNGYFGASLTGNRAVLPGDAGRRIEYDSNSFTGGVGPNGRNVMQGAQPPPPNNAWQQRTDHALLQQYTNRVNNERTHVTFFHKSEHRNIITPMAFLGKTNMSLRNDEAKRIIKKRSGT